MNVPPLVPSEPVGYYLDDARAPVTKLKWLCSPFANGRDGFASDPAIGHCFAKGSQCMKSGVDVEDIDVLTSSRDGRIIPFINDRPCEYDSISRQLDVCRKHERVGGNEAAYLFGHSQIRSHLGDTSTYGSYPFPPIVSQEYAGIKGHASCLKDAPCGHKRPFFVILDGMGTDLNRWIASC